MVFGANGGDGKPRIVEQAAQSVFMTGMARIAIVVWTVIIGPLMVAAVLYGFSWAAAQSEINQRQSNALSLLEYRLGRAEEANREQEKHFQFSDRRINRLERMIPDRPDWSGNPD